MLYTNSNVDLGKGDFTVTMNHSPLDKGAFKVALNDCRPSGVGRFRSVKKGQFDSSIEWGRGVWLYNMQKYGLISELSHHANITFTCGDQSIKYEADFTYFCNKELFVEDVKPGRIACRTSVKESVMLPGNEFVEYNKHVKPIATDTNLRRVNFLLTCANLKLICVPILGSASFFRDARMLSASFFGGS